MDGEFAFKSTTLVGEDTDLLLLLLYYHEATNCTELYFHLDKVKANVYNIKGLKKIRGEAVCNDLLFIHAFTGCDSTSRVFGIGKKSGFQRNIKKEEEMKDSSKVFCSPLKRQDVVDTSGCRWLCSMQIRMTPWHLSSTICPQHPQHVNCSPLRAYYQVMEWIG